MCVCDYVAVVQPKTGPSQITSPQLLMSLENHPVMSLLAGFKSQVMSHGLIANRLAAKSAGQLASHVHSLP